VAEIIQGPFHKPVNDRRKSDGHQHINKARQIIGENTEPRRNQINDAPVNQIERLGEFTQPPVERLVLGA
jgi:hypothetical protein